MQILKPLWDILSHLSEWPPSIHPPTTDDGEDVEKGGALVHCWWECRLGQPLCKAVWRVGPQEIITETTLRPSDSTTEYVSKETPNTNLKQYTHPYVRCSVTYKSRYVTNPSVHQERSEWWRGGTYIQRILPGPQKGWNLTICRQHAWA